MVVPTVVEAVRENVPVENCLIDWDMLISS